MALALGLGACASLSPLPDPAASPAPGTPTEARVEGARGPASPAESRRTLGTVRAEGRSRQFENHLAGLTALGETLSAGNGVRLLVDGPATFEAMFRDLAVARHRILLESYIFEDSAIGRRMAEVLLKKRGEGLEVRVIYDSLGAFDTPAEFFAALRAGGVEVCEFNPLSAVKDRAAPLDVNHRDHRKVLVVDDRVAFTGGINISGVYSSASPRPRPRRADPAGWRDTHVRLDGPVARDLARGFQETWQRQQCGGSPFPAPGAGPRPLPASDDRLVLAIHTYGDGDSSRFYRALLAAIQGATDSIRITMAYFVPDPGLLEALQGAARRGVKTELVLPGHSDSLLALRAGQARYAELLAAGVRLFERHDTYLHAKTAVIDGVWSTVGSSNLDWRSFVHNDEVNVVVLGREFGAEMERLFAEDVGHADELSAAAWADRGLGRRVMERFGLIWQYWF